MEDFFKLKERGTTIRKEFVAGMVTFFAMCYILSVNAGMFSNPLGDGSNPLGVSFGAIYIGTGLAAIVGALLMGLLANLPLALASAMGADAFFVYSVCLALGMSYPNALVLTLIDGILFIALTVTGLRRLVFDSIPTSVRKGIMVGLGLFIALLGLQSAGIVVAHPSTGVTLASFNVMTNKWGALMPCLVALGTFWTICALSHRNVPGAVFIGLFAGTVAYYFLGVTVSGFYDTVNLSLESPFAAFKAFGKESFGQVFTRGFDFSPYIAEHGMTSFALVFATTAVSMCMMDLFDTLGTLYATCGVGNLLTKEGNVPNMNRAMLADSIATTVGAACGVSTVSTFVESSAGVMEGGRTGLTSIFTALFFGLALFLTPIARLVPSCATSACLVYVGALMLGGAKNIDWRRLDVAIPAFMTICMIPFTCNIAFGIAFGMFSYVIMSFASKRASEISASSWVVTILFGATLFLTH